MSGHLSDQLRAHTGGCREERVYEVRSCAPVGIGSVQASAFSQSSAIWSDGMTNELTFNATKLIAKRLDMLSSEELLPSDIGVWDRDLAERRVAHKLELREGRAKAAAKKRAKAAAQRDQVVVTPGARVYFMPCAAVCGFESHAARYSPLCPRHRSPRRSSCRCRGRTCPRRSAI